MRKIVAAAAAVVAALALSAGAIVTVGSSGGSTEGLELLYCQLTGCTMAGSVDLNGVGQLILDADGDTNISAAVDDTVVLDVNGGSLSVCTDACPSFTSSPMLAVEGNVEVDGAANVASSVTAGSVVTASVATADPASTAMVINGSVVYLRANGVNRIFMSSAEVGINNTPFNFYTNKLYSSTAPLYLGTTAATGHALASGDVLVGGKLEVDGACYLDSTAAIAGAATMNGAVTLGDAYADAVAVKGQAKFGPAGGTADYVLTFNGDGATSTLTHNHTTGVLTYSDDISVQTLTAVGNTTIGDNASADTLTVSATAIHLGGIRAAQIKGDLAATCTAGDLAVDTGGATVEFCYCNATDTWLCAALAAGPTD